MIIDEIQIVWYYHIRLSLLRARLLEHLLSEFKIMKNLAIEHYDIKYMILSL